MAASLADAKRWAKKRCERLLYRVGGLPVAVGALLFGDSTGAVGTLRAAYAANYWHPENLQDLAELLTAGVIWPISLVGAALWFTWKNGAVVRDRFGKSRISQFAEECRAYFSAGVLPRWYYAFELYNGRSSAESYISRFETKRGYYEMLSRSRGAQSPLGDKLAFARHCEIYQIPAVPVIGVAAGGQVNCFEPNGLPPADLFVKPIRGRGGTGAERWDQVGGGRYRGPGDAALDWRGLFERLRRESRAGPPIVQPRVVNCAELNDINNGALSTIRVVTCLNEHGWPEVVAAAMRMAKGDNHRVDNFHAGGIASAVDLQSGELGPASNMGMDARAGWLDRHPDSGGQITGRQVPRWEEVCRLAERAHWAFDDRVMIGWDIAVTPDGPVLVEGNAAPDLDIIQRTRRSGLGESRLCQLLRYHVSEARAAAPRV